MVTCSYDLASKLSDRLDEMGKDLTSMIEEINDASSNLGRNKQDDPVSQQAQRLRPPYPSLLSLKQLYTNETPAFASRPRFKHPPDTTPTNRSRRLGALTESPRSAKNGATDVAGC